MRNQSGNNPTAKKQENAGAQDVINFSFAMWSVERIARCFWGSHKAKKAKPMESQINLDT